ncbi:hypothetical protein V6N13_067657 [Hibiscus sabdariffa]|uniref:Uncharacterized protein n=2 Tax=Hibiscus sabdariffa TaxID=183260 RepID=A0ABR2DVK8_9ROSI
MDQENQNPSVRMTLTVYEGLDGRPPDDELASISDVMVRVLSVSPPLVDDRSTKRGKSVSFDFDINIESDIGNSMEVIHEPMLDEAVKEGCGGNRFVPLDKGKVSYVNMGDWVYIGERRYYRQFGRD